MQILMPCARPCDTAAPVTIGEALGDNHDRAAVRDSLLAVRVTLPDGATAQFGSRVMKDVAGHDMKRLSIGSGKRFGSLQQVTLKVRPQPHGTKVGTIER